MASLSRLIDRATPHEEPAPGALPVAFGSADRAMAGVYHAPVAVPPQALGVVLCNPFGYEAMSLHRTYRHLAERLVERGSPVLRFDYEDAGDSAGECDQAGRVRAAVAGIRAAIAQVRARSGVARVALVGVRLGASLAALAASEEGGLDALVSWAPILSGRVHVRELKAFRLLKDPKSGRRDGGEEVGGYLYTAETLAELSAIDLLSLPSRLAERVLVLPRTETSREEGRLVDHLRSRGADVSFAPTGEYGRMMRDDPYESVVPTKTLEKIVDWLTGGAPPLSSRPGAAPAGRRAPSSTLRVPPANGRPALRETALLFGRDQRLFGVVTEPESPARMDRPAVVLLNVGGNHHVGPHRMNVDVARELAARGYLAFRFDAAGLGESPPAPGGRENQIYSLDAVGDVQAAMDVLGERHRVSRFVLVGLCSGAYAAFHSAVADARVVGQVLLSPYAFEWKEGDPVTPQTREAFHSTRFYAKSILDRQVWLRALRGDVEVRAIAGVLVERLKTRIDAEVPKLMARLRGTLRPQNDVERAFLAMSERGVETLMVLSFDDGGLDMVSRYLGTDARKMRGRPNFVFQVMDDADHTFTTLASQGKLLGMLTGYMRRCFP